MHFIGSPADSKDFENVVTKKLRSAKKQSHALKNYKEELSSILSENEDSVSESDLNCDFNYRDLTQEEYLNLSSNVSEKIGMIFFDK